MTCFSCHHYTLGRKGIFCAKHKSGFPDVGVACTAFCYEPGADELEVGDGNES